ncbi:Uncharacterised protein [Afipia felis]|uniref:Uncharacterized protein n=2 Tax=Afipia felis TaxID=1035 RepID=A0A380WB01_AFIFE|nr:hypothetical protein AfiDRAFT_2737 [Afipia sp. 1NLS2]EKS29194.1 hypothetical protein HMPREF9697_01722 [Afipia felis ATCC 53690]SUU77901.1 Uncharacterised protein [Afipia felis]SUU85966.1 Uncharacterised protein [Afipia felis]
MHMLQNHPISLDQSRPQDVVACDKFIKSTCEAMLVERSFEPQHP